MFSTVRSSSSYDSVKRVINITNQNFSTNNAYSSFTYSYDSNGNITAIADTAAITSYGYDKLNRLIDVKVGSSPTTSYQYDNLGNREYKYESTGTTSYSYDAASQLTSYTKPGGEIVTSAYDANGNLTSEQSSTQGTIQYSYDNQDNLVKIVKPNGDTAEFVYDGRGNRYKKTVNGFATYYQYDSRGNILLETDSSQNIKVKYIRDAAGKAISMEQGNDLYHFIYNGRGDVTSVVDDSGTTVATYAYDEFGNLSASTGTIYNPLRYSGANNAYFDSETGLYKMGVRYYKSEIGRWITRDKYLGERKEPGLYSKYVYCINNPIKNIDPTGNIPVVAKQSKAKISAWGKITDVVNITINRVNSYHYFVYDGTNITSESGSSTAWWLAYTGWFKQWGPRFYFYSTNHPRPSNWAKADAGFINESFPGGPYVTAIVVQTYVYGDGRVTAQYIFGINENGRRARMKTYGGYSRQQIY